MTPKETLEVRNADRPSRLRSSKPMRNFETGWTLPDSKWSVIQWSVLWSSGPACRRPASRLASCWSVGRTWRRRSGTIRCSCRRCASRTTFSPGRLRSCGTDNYCTCASRGRSRVRWTSPSTSSWTTPAAVTSGAAIPASSWRVAVPATWARSWCTSARYRLRSPTSTGWMLPSEVSSRRQAHRRSSLSRSGTRT